MSEPNTYASTDFRDTVRSCFAAALKRDDFDDQTDFFALGGDSLGATNVLTHIAESTGRTLSVENFFQHPTVDALAAIVASNDGTSTDNNLDNLVDDLSDLDDETLARLLQ